MSENKLTIDMVKNLWEQEEKRRNDPPIHQYVVTQEHYDYLKANNHDMSLYVVPQRMPEQLNKQEG